MTAPTFALFAIAERVLVAIGEELAVLAPLPTCLSGLGGGGEAGGAVGASGGLGLVLRAWDTLCSSGFVALSPPVSV